MLLLTRPAREQARQRALSDAYARAWRFEDEETPGVTLVNTFAFASFYARSTLHLTLASALLLTLAAAPQVDPHANPMGQLLAVLLAVASVVFPLVAGFRTAREVDKQAFLPPSE